jgi:hypothetical protein
MPRKKTGGRLPGTPNKKTIARLERENIAQKVRTEVVAASRARSEVSHKRAKEVMEEFLPVVRGIAAYYQPTFPGMGTQNPNGKESKFKEWLGVLFDLTKILAPYQDARFNAINVVVELL